MRFVVGLGFVLAVGVLAFLGGLAQGKAEARAQADAEWAEFIKEHSQLDDSTTVALASEKLEHDSLATVVRASQALHATLVAGLRLKVPEKTVAKAPGRLATALSADSTRTATFRDSTALGVVSVRITAPPCCDPLRLDSLKVWRPAFSPAIGFVQHGSKVAAVVVFQGDTVRAEHVFYKPLPPKRLSTYLDVGYRAGEGPAAALESTFRLREPFSLVGRVSVSRTAAMEAFVRFRFGTP